MFSYLRCFVVTSLLAISILFTACSSPEQNQNSSTSPNANAVSKPKASGPPLYEGFFDIGTCDVIHGWAWNQADPEAALNIEIYDGTTLLSTVKANEPRGDLVNVGKGTGKYGYSYTPPPALRDHKPHVIHVKIAGSDYEVGNSPKTLTCSLP